MDPMIELYVIVNGEKVKNPDLTEEAFAAEAEARKQLYISQLWEAAHAYEYAEINGTGTGLLVLGVMKNTPKAMAVQTWVTSIWDLYYKRKLLVTHECDPKLLDFGICGSMPYSIPELMEEALA